MEIFSKKTITFLHLHFIIILLGTAVTTADITSQELDAALSALRSNGYTLFPNAIATSDLHIRLLTSQPSSSFTLFSPPDALLFSLDLLSSASLYTHSLLLHVSPRFFSASDLVSLPTPYLDTLLPTRHLFIQQTMIIQNRTSYPSVTLDGVRVSAPDIFLGSNIAVHGLDGILVSRYSVSANDDVYADLEPVLAPMSWCKSCFSPTYPPDRVPKKMASDFHHDHGRTNMSRHGAFFRFKHLFNG